MWGPAGAPARAAAGLRPINGALAATHGDILPDGRGESSGPPAAQSIPTRPSTDAISFAES